MVKKITLFDENLDKKATFEIPYVVKKQSTGEIFLIIAQANGFSVHSVTDHVCRQPIYDQKCKTFYKKLQSTDPSEMFRYHNQNFLVFSDAAIDICINKYTGFMFT